MCINTGLNVDKLNYKDAYIFLLIPKLVPKIILKNNYKQASQSALPF